MSVIDHVTLLSPARIEGRVARNNFTPIVGRTTSSGFNVFASGWVLRSAGLKGSGHGGRTPEHPTPRVIIPSSHDLACLVEPLAIHLDPTEPSGDMDYTSSLRRTRRLRAAMRG